MAARKKNIERIAEMLSALGEVDVDKFSDDSGSWAELKIGNRQLIFSFDGKGENLTGINLYEDVVEVVDSKRLFGLNLEYKTPKKEGKDDEKKPKVSVVGNPSNVILAC